jgi:hypothetical protein
MGREARHAIAHPMAAVMVMTAAAAIDLEYHDGARLAFCLSAAGGPSRSSH